MYDMIDIRPTRKITGLDKKKAIEDSETWWNPVRFGALDSFDEICQNIELLRRNLSDFTGNENADDNFTILLCVPQIDSESELWQNDILPSLFYL